MMQMSRIESQHPGVSGSLRFSKDGLRQLESNTMIQGPATIRHGSLLYDCSKDKYVHCLDCGKIIIDNGSRLCKDCLAWHEEA